MDAHPVTYILPIISNLNYTKKIRVLLKFFCLLMRVSEMKSDIGIDNAEILHIMEILTKYDK